MPVKPFNPEALAFPSGGKSKPMPVIVDVEPGWVIADVFVIVKVNVFVCELNSQTTIAVENWPESAPVTVIVSARTLVLAATKTNSATSEKTILPDRDMGFLLVSTEHTPPAGPHCSADQVERESLRGNCKSHFGVVWRDIISLLTRGQSLDLFVTKFQHA